MEIRDSEDSTKYKLIKYSALTPSSQSHQIASSHSTARLSHPINIQDDENIGEDDDDEEETIEIIE